jgi:hypothetical protein
MAINDGAIKTGGLFDQLDKAHYDNDEDFHADVLE